MNNWEKNNSEYNVGDPENSEIEYYLSMPEENEDVSINTLSLVSQQIQKGEISQIPLIFVFNEIFDFGRILLRIPL